jgi:hypothetical protein
MLAASVALNQLLMVAGFISDAGYGQVLAGVDGAEVTTLLVAMTVTVYDCPLVSPVSWQDRPLVVQVPPDGDALAVYPVMGRPPPVAAVHEALTVPSPGVRVRAVGAPSGVEPSTTWPVCHGPDSTWVNVRERTDVPRVRVSVRTAGFHEKPAGRAASLTAVARSASVGGVDVDWAAVFAARAMACPVASSVRSAAFCVTDLNVGTAITERTPMISRAASRSRRVKPRRFTPAVAPAVIVGTVQGAHLAATGRAVPRGCQRAR